MFVEHWKLSVLEENNVVLDDNSVEGKPCKNRESKSLELKSYTDVIMNMNFLAVVTPRYIYQNLSLKKNCNTDTYICTHVLIVA